ncbi:Superfamily II DNA or RNA helicase, SNF2 family [Desulfonatronum thiosulfatophilum]|uniref:Superfamily II DNA or RNA helicase, SNF2 family n=1 Tax=Desulfonatronum thiosulfatophilum TaxID=617002 RepID=A0A1G6DAL1_9BACT|nr:DEAD/DEAH box helicase [Desulfonatronum thiosulfatophilum]SDB42196.1 Superfamily II DNA or RNA helicase, SNF2 family [Desulfonatronum thiosulfatophilum]
MNFSDNQRKLETLLANLQHLSSDDQRILQVLTVAWKHLTITELQKILLHLDWRDSRGTPLHQAVTKAWQERMERLHLLSVKNARFQCNEMIREEPARTLALEKKYAEVHRVVLKLLPLPEFSWNNPMDFSKGYHRMRTDLYLGKYSDVMRGISGVSSTWDLLPSHEVAQLARLCLYPLNRSWVEQLPDVLKFQVLGTSLMKGMEDLIPRNTHFELAEKWFPKMAQNHSGPKYVMAQQYLIRGNLQSARELLGVDQNSTDLSLLGWWHFVRGEYDQAMEAFDACIIIMKRETRKRNVRIPGMAGIFHNLCLLRRGEPEDLRLIPKQAGFMAKGEIPDPYAEVFAAFADAALILLGEKKPSSCKDLAGTYNLQHFPYPALFRPLIRSWLGQDPIDKQLKALSDNYHIALSGGYLWYAEEAEMLLRKMGKIRNKKSVKESAKESNRERTDVPQKNEHWASITELLKPKASWELALDALKNIGATVSPSARGSGGETRMTWRLRCLGEVCVLEPREQKRKKNGQWTTGKNVSPYRLHDSPEDFSSLTDHDRRISQASFGRMSGSYSRYGGGYSIQDLDQALLAAVGHPLIFWEDDPERPVELVKSEPALQVLEEKEKLRLRIDPTPVAGRNLVRREETRHRLRLVHFDERHLKIADILGLKGLTVPVTAKERVLASIAEIAPLLAVHSNIGGSPVQAEEVAADSRPVIRLRPINGGLGMELFLRPIAGGNLLIRPGEGGKTLFAEVDGRQYCAVRDIQAEQLAVKKVLESCPVLDPDANWSWLIEDSEEALETLLQLQELGESVVLEWPEGQRIKVVPEADSSKMRISVRQRKDWFSLEGELQLEDGRVLEMAQLLALLEQSPGRFIRLEEGDFLSLTRDLRKRLDAVRGYSDAGRFNPLAAPAMEDVLQGMRVDATKPWKDLLRRLRESRDLTPEVPTTLRAELRDYQVEGFQWLARLAHWGAGACLADDMGLGKTIQALALILTRAKLGPTLVLAPTSVCINWMDESARFAPSLRPLRFGPGAREQMLTEAGPFDLIVCSYGLLQTQSEQLAKVEWSTLVADEAQAIKNVFTKRSRAAMALPAGFRMITTGTPIENHLGELWNLFNFINPGLLNSMERFNRKFAVPIEQNKDNEARRRLKNLIRPFILRRLKSEVLAELPSRTEVVLPVELSPEESAIYEAIRRNALEKMSEPMDQPGQQRIRMLAEIMRLRRACCHPELVMPGNGATSSKLQAFGEILDELLENRHQALVFSQFTGHLKLVRDYLDKRKVHYQYLDGSTPIKQRQAAVNAFQAGEGDLFLISLKAGGFGLNLTAADYVIHMDPWWNPAVEDQASDRAHRIGQQRPVTIYRLVTKGTIEEKILDLHRHKRDLATSLLEGTDSGAKLSLEEMLELLKE